MQHLSKGRAFDASTFDLICDQFLRLFPSKDVQEAFSNFSWVKAKTKAKTFEEAVLTRNDIAKKFSPWVLAGCPEETAVANIELVHKWGFGRGLNKNEKVLYEEPYFSNFISMIKIWKDQSSPQKMHESLARCLTTPYVKIARFSKWICFIDQNKFAIYDSRVSCALRQLKVNNSRIFPTVGGRSAGRPGGGFKSIDKMAEIYLLYTDMLTTLLGNYELNSVAELEMALFMLGTDSKYW